jgi:Mg-chelatase subunit ChlD
MNNSKAVQIDPRDNVAVALSDVKTGDKVNVVTETEIIEIIAKSDITFGHKIALIDFEPQKPIVKYGEEIGKSCNAITIGEWVHLHNVYCERGRED